MNHALILQKDPLSQWVSEAPDSGWGEGVLESVKSNAKALGFELECAVKKAKWAFYTTR